MAMPSAVEFGQASPKNTLSSESNWYAKVDRGCSSRETNRSVLQY